MGWNSLVLDDVTDIQWCSKSCEVTSSTYNADQNTCDCDSGYATLSLVGSEHQCEAKCDLTTTTLSGSNTCVCNTGYATLSTSSATNTQSCLKTCEATSATYNTGTKNCDCNFGYVTPLTLVGSSFQCLANCNSWSSILSNGINCNCKSGWTNKTTIAIGNTLYNQ